MPTNQSKLCLGTIQACVAVVEVLQKIYSTYNDSIAVVTCGEVIQELNKLTVKGVNDEH